MRRVAAKGCHSMTFPENPAALGYLSFHDPYWNPVWQAACDTNTVLSVHIGSSGRLAADLLWSRTLKEFPSEVFREHFLTCFITDRLGIRLSHEIGIDNICWEGDYPHSDSLWPDAPEQLHDVFTECAVPDQDIARMSHENAMRWCSFDPFAHLPREQCTVGALRRAAEGHDVSVRSRSRRLKEPVDKLEAFRQRARAAVAAASR